MSAGTLPPYVDAQKWADREAVIDQVYPLSAFPRLSEGVVGDEGQISVHCRFYRDQQHLIVLEGRIKAELPLICQRCLDAVLTAVDTDFQLWLLRDEEAADRLPDDADYLVQDEEGRVALADALEDELILALPLVPMHDDCDALPLAQVESEVVETPKRENPFQVLAGFKVEPDKSDD